MNAWFGSQGSDSSPIKFAVSLKRGSDPRMLGSIGFLIMGG